MNARRPPSPGTATARTRPPDSTADLTERLFPAEFGHLTGAIASLRSALAATAVERDRLGGSPVAERELLRASGLLTLAIPRAFGGHELPWPEIYRIVRHLAAVDSSLAHLFAFQHLQVATLLLFASPEQQRYWLSRTVQERWFWGNASNGRDTGLALSRSGDHYLLQGSKSFCSGALGADALIVTAPGIDAPGLIFLALPASRPGIEVYDDWDGFGQRQTDSGTVHFNGVRLHADELLAPGNSPRRSLRTCVSQLILTQLFLGNAEGALAAALRYTREQGRPPAGSEAGSASEDPFVARRFGELWLRYRSALLLAEDAATRLQQAWEKPGLTAAERGAVALAISEAKVASARAALDITADIFEAMGARATSARYGFDRFWRNVRVHSLHDSIDYKVRDLGHWLLSGEPPAPGLYA